MKYAYRLIHCYEKGDNNKEVKLIGIYSSRENASRTIKRYKKLPGFKLYPDSFYIENMKLIEVIGKKDIKLSDLYMKY